MFGKKEEKKETITVNPENLSVEDKTKDEPQLEEVKSQELSISDVLTNQEIRIQALEAALFRIKGAI